MGAFRPAALRIIGLEWRPIPVTFRSPYHLLPFHQFFAYDNVLRASSTCRVSFTDGAKVTHTVTVSTSSLYEAAVPGIAEFGRSGFAFGSMSPATRIRVLVEPPAIAHELCVAKLRAWLDGNAKTPNEQAKKVTLRQLARENRHSRDPRRLAVNLENAMLTTSIRFALTKSSLDNSYPDGLSCDLMEGSGRSSTHSRSIGSAGRR